jgi:CRP/FNR family transcriptional activator FtrB
MNPALNCLGFDWSSDERPYGKVVWDKLKAVKAFPVFAKLPCRAQERLAAVAGLQRIGKNTTLFREGESAEFIYALIEGHVALVSGEGGSQTIAEFMSAGELVLISPALLDLPYMASGRATTEVVALLIPASTFRDLVKTEAALAEAIAHSLAVHWRLLLTQLKQIKTRDVDSRLAQYLLDSSNKTSGSALVTLPSSKRQLASHLGMTAETLSRSLKRLRPLGITSRDRSIKISSVEGLATFARTSHLPMHLRRRHNLTLMTRRKG